MLSTSTTRAFCSVLFAFGGLARAQEPQDPAGSAEPAQDTAAEADELTDLSLEQLMNVEVSIASRSDQKLVDAPAAVYVITGDEMRRAGFTTVQEALRMVPGFTVVRYDSHVWFVTARGFSSGFANNLLVMLDGVSLYTPLFAGTFWEIVDIDVADIDRIEIIRGPGASLWGANAVNGVINIITKHARDTTGGHVSFLLGGEENGFGVRWGAEVAENSWLKVWFHGMDHDNLVDANGDETDEDWAIGQLGFRWDRQLADDERLMLSGRAFTAQVRENYFVATPTPPFGDVVYDDTPRVGFSLLGLWDRTGADGSGTKLQAWYVHDFYRQVDFEQNIDIFDVDFQRMVRLSQSHRLLFGLGHQLIYSHLPSDFTYTFDPITRTQSIPRAFAHDEWSFTDLGLSLVWGGSVLHHPFSGFEVQPDARITWKANERHTFWTAASRAVRTPSIDENDIVFRLPFDSTSGDFFSLEGSDEVDSEKALATELGWRWQPAPSIALDLTAFYNNYTDLMTEEFGTPYSQGGLTFYPFIYDNLGEAEAWGVELAADWNVSERWRLRSAFTFYERDARAVPPSNDGNFVDTERNQPKHQVNLRSYYDLGDSWELDAGFYYVDSLPYFLTPHYVRVDARLGFEPGPGMRFSLGVQNATEDRHPETDVDLAGYGIEVPRNIYISFTCSR